MSTQKAPVTMKSWVMAMRPKTLGAAWVPVICASALAASRMDEPLQRWIVICALLSSLFIQIATNLFNDAIDFKKGADSVSRLGPTRVTQAGLIPIQTVFRAGVVCALVAAAFGAPLVWHGGTPIVVLGLVSLFLAYGYTGGPWPLAYLGLGDLFVFLFFGLGAVLGTYYLQSQSLDFPNEAWILASQIGLWATALIAINNFRDSEEDRRNRKMTLAARFGASFSRIEILVLLIGPYVIGFLFWPGQGFFKAGTLPLLTLPLALRICHRVWTLEPSRQFNALLAQSGAVHMLSGVLLALGFYLK